MSALLELLPTALDKALAESRLTFFEYAVLDTLAGVERHRLRLSALASRTNATLPRLSRVITSLERKGYVARTPCEEDGRATNAVLTERGGDALSTARPLYTDAVRTKILDGLDRRSVDELGRLSLAVLTRLDPDGRLSVTAEAGACAADPLSALQTTAG
ncbi:MarR family winged helix-turn-helix transcriptional regulator [Microbacterium sp. NPDC055683]